MILLLLLAAAFAVCITLYLVLTAGTHFEPAEDDD